MEKCKTNFEKIKTMNMDELTEFMYKIMVKAEAKSVCGAIKQFKCPESLSCKECVRNYLAGSD